jgi:hypothetical protein
LDPAASPGDTVSIVERDAAGNRSVTPWRMGVPRLTVSAATFARGDAAVVTGVNFQPGESVTGVMRSAPVDLGAVTADANGEVTLSWTVPANTAIGSHEVTLTGALSGAWTTGFEVVVNHVTPPPAVSGAGSLPVTGAGSVGASAALAIAGVLAGLLLVSLARVRRLRA